MKRRNFLTTCFAALAALFTPKPRARPLRFFWVDEETELFVAYDIAALNECFGRGGPEPWANELLTMENRGELWDYVDDSIMLHCEENMEARDLAGWGRQLQEYQWFRERPVAQLGSSYN